MADQVKGVAVDHRGAVAEGEVNRMTIMSPVSLGAPDQWSNCIMRKQVLSLRGIASLR